jgi:hypothetical protein
MIDFLEVGAKRSGGTEDVYCVSGPRSRQRAVHAVGGNGLRSLPERRKTGRTKEISPSLFPEMALTALEQIGIYPALFYLSGEH